MLCQFTFPRLCSTIKLIIKLHKINKKTKIVAQKLAAVPSEKPYILLMTAIGRCLSICMTIGMLACAIYSACVKMASCQARIKMWARRRHSKLVPMCGIGAYCRDIVNLKDIIIKWSTFTACWSKKDNLKRSAKECNNYQSFIWLF